MSKHCPHCKGKCCYSLVTGYRIPHMACELYDHSCDYCDNGEEYVAKYDGLDNPEWDGTDLAHPAWWRGNDVGVDSTVLVIQEILNNIESGKENVGTFGSQKLNMLRDRLYQMYGK